MYSLQSTWWALGWELAWSEFVTRGNNTSLSMRSMRTMRTMPAALVRLTRSLAKPSLLIVDVKFSLLLTVVIQVDKQTMDHCKIKMFWWVVSFLPSFYCLAFVPEMVLHFLSLAGASNLRKLILSGKRHCESNAFCPGTQLTDPVTS